MTKRKVRGAGTDSPEQITAAEAKKRMKEFMDRKEKFVAAVKKSKN
jgi:hypothetical protein